MSNIDKRALREAAEKAKDNFMPNLMVPTRDVLALLDELEAAEKLVNQQGNIAVALFDGVTTLRRNADDKAPELRSQLEEAENRIAELEAREVKLPKPISVLHRRDFMDSHRSIYAYPEAEVNAALADAGINVAAAGKGE